MFATLGTLASKVNIERVIHSVKTALACLVGLFLTKVVHFAVDQWLIITLVVVMCAQINIGSMINKSTMRFLGTLSGSLVAALTILLLGTDTIAISVIIALSAMLFSYLATAEKSYSEAGTLGAVTVVIILIGHDPTVYTALYRFLEITTGILIAGLISQFVIPIRASNHLHKMQAKTIAELYNYYELCFIKKLDEDTVLELDETIVKSLSSQRKLAKEAAHEPFGPVFDSDNFIKLLRCEKEIFRGMVCMNYAAKMLVAQKSNFTTLPAIQHLHFQLSSILKKISRSIEQKNLFIGSNSIPSLQPIKDAINSSRTTSQSEEIIYMDGFLFCAEILVVQLTELVILVEKKFA